MALCYLPLHLRRIVREGREKKIAVESSNSCIVENNFMKIPLDSFSPCLKCYLTILVCEKNQPNIVSMKTQFLHFGSETLPNFRFNLKCRKQKLYYYEVEKVNKKKRHNL